jgi:hypothetical protein
VHTRQDGGDVDLGEGEAVDGFELGLVAVKLRGDVAAGAWLADESFGVRWSRCASLWGVEALHPVVVEDDEVGSRSHLNPGVRG